MNRNIVMKKILMFIIFFCSAYLVPMHILILYAQSEKSDYYQKGKEYLNKGNFDAAVESFKKVLYVNRYHARSSFALAEIYESQKRFKKAAKEYRYCLSVIPSDKLLGEEERTTLVHLVEHKLNEIHLARKTEKELYKGKLNLVEINIVLFAVTICVFVAFKGGLLVRRFVRGKLVAHQESKIWLDRYWERRKEREIRTPTSRTFQIVFYCFLIFIVLFAGSIIARHGFSETFNSIWHTFRSWCM